MSGTIQMAQTLATALIAGIGTAIIATAQPHEGGLTEGVTWILAITVAFAPPQPPHRNQMTSLQHQVLGSHGDCASSRMGLTCHPRVSEYSA